MPLKSSRALGFIAIAGIVFTLLFLTAAFRKPRVIHLAPGFGILDLTLTRGKVNRYYFPNILVWLRRGIAEYARCLHPVAAIAERYPAAGGTNVLWLALQTEACCNDLHCIYTHSTGEQREWSLDEAHAVLGGPSPATTIHVYPIPLTPSEASEKGVLVLRCGPTGRLIGEVRIR